MFRLMCCLLPLGVLFNPIHAQPDLKTLFADALTPDEENHTNGVVWRRSKENNVTDMEQYRKLFAPISAIRNEGASGERQQKLLWAMTHANNNYRGGLVTFLKHKHKAPIESKTWPIQIASLAEYAGKNHLVRKRRSYDSFLLEKRVDPKVSISRLQYAGPYLQKRGSDLGNTKSAFNIYDSDVNLATSLRMRTVARRVLELRKLLQWVRKRLRNKLSTNENPSTVVRYLYHHLLPRGRYSGISNKTLNLSSKKKKSQMRKALRDLQSKLVRAKDRIRNEYGLSVSRPKERVTGLDWPVEGVKKKCLLKDGTWDDCKRPTLTTTISSGGFGDFGDLEGSRWGRQFTAQPWGNIGLSAPPQGYGRPVGVGRLVLPPRPMGGSGGSGWGGGSHDYGLATNMNDANSQGFEAASDELPREETSTFASSSEFYPQNPHFDPNIGQETWYDEPLPDDQLGISSPEVDYTEYLKSDADEYNDPKRSEYELID